MDTFARMRQLVGNTAAWAANNLVLGDGEIGVERVSATDIRVKVGDGSSAWSALPYASATSTAINAAVQAALDAKVSKSGDTMTGLLVLSGDPTAPLGAATKQYADAIQSALSTSIAGKLSSAGGTLTGALTLSGDPTAALAAATKQYVDGLVNGKLNKAGDTMSGALVLAADPAAPLEAATKQYVDGGSYQTVVGGSATYAGKVVKLNAQGLLDTSIVPVAASYLGTVNITLPYSLTGTYPAGSYFSVSASGTIDSTWHSKINGTHTTAGAGQFLIHNANGKWDLVGDTSSSSAISGKLDKAGGTMTGALVLAGNPTAALDAAPKQYVDTMVPKAGGTMTGLLVLSADPTAPLGAATKQYVDNKLAGGTAYLPLAGGTMTGLLTLSGNATAALGAVTKQQMDAVDTAVRAAFATADTAVTTAFQTADAARVSKAGDTMTGLLTLSGPPTADLHAATKKYADDRTGSVPENAQAGSYSLVAADKGKAVTINSASAATVTVPAVFAAGDRVDIIQLGAGQVSFAGSGVTIRSAGGKLKLSVQYSGATLWFKSATEAVLLGDLVA